MESLVEPNAFFQVLAAQEKLPVDASFPLANAN